LREHDLVASLGIDIGQSHVPVALAITPDTMATWFLDALCEVPNLLYTLKIDNAEQGTRLLARGDVLAAVTFGVRQVQGCDAIALGALRYMPVCSPSFFERWFADGLSAEAFQQAPSVTYNEQDRLQIEFALKACGQPVVPPSHYMADAHGLCHAAACGLGWVMLPHLLAQPLLDDGRLVLVSTEHHVNSELSWQLARASQVVMRPLTRAVRKVAARLLLQ
jgi:LysR family transcriptional regulator, chromosome initiation inhibitor